MLRPRRGAWCVAALLAPGLCGFAFAGSISVGWDAVPGATGYTVYHGTAPGSYTASVDVGAATSATLDGLADCTDHYVAVKARGPGGQSVAFSDEVSGWPRPRVETLVPAAGDQGSQFTLQIRGANFRSGATLTWDSAGMPRDLAGDPLVRLASIRVVACDRIDALVTVESPQRGFRAAPVGPVALDFELVNPDSVFGTGTGTLRVDFDARRADVNRSDSSTVDRVDGQDLTWLAFAYGSREGAERFNADADLDGSGLVDGEDLALLSQFFGLCWTGTAWNPAACR